MSSPVFGFSSWRRGRSASIQSQHTVASTSGTSLATGHEEESHRAPLNNHRSSLTPLWHSRSVQGSSFNINNNDGQQQQQQQLFSSSLNSTSGFREPKRSFIHGPIREELAHVDTVQSARSVRQDTAELASYFLSDHKERPSPSFLSRARSNSSHNGIPDLDGTLPEAIEPESVADTVSTSDYHSAVSTITLTAANKTPETIAEVSEPSSPDTITRLIPDSADPGGDGQASGGTSMLTTMLRRSPPGDRYLHVSGKEDQVHENNIVSEEEEDQEDSSDDGEDEGHRRRSGKHARPYRGTPRRRSTIDSRDAEREEPPDEFSPLIHAASHDSRRSYGIGNGYGGFHSESRDGDIEGQKGPSGRRGEDHESQQGWWARTVANPIRHKGEQVAGVIKVITHPQSWDRHALWENVVVAPVVCLPAVIVGLLLNILDALSYGMILFPLGSPIFSHLGSAGISIFYVSTIISQVTFSSGSIFKGGVGSELIEVVPFFHSMAATITDLVGESNPDAVIATTITSYALSSMLTGTVFYLMGKFKFGYLVGFIPRHILIGCIGGVGWFLVATGFEVTARLDGSLNYDLETLKRLMRGDTVPLWIIPLVLAVMLFYGQSKVKSKYFLPLYILAIPAAFYAFALALGHGAVQPDVLRGQGWVFEGPPAGEPWWYFYTLYKFHLVDWGAIVQCIPAMFALTFFGILHVPINVPALALNTGEDHANLDHELKLHGYSNFLSGLAGSIQNYLVYANTVFFMRSGGNSRLAGFELAILTFFVMTIGPSLIGFIPVMVVGVLIFDLGFELLLEAVWQPRKKLKMLEYLTVIVIVLIMGTYDFVVGIGVGILLAFISLIIQASRVSAVRASYSGDVVVSTVRRNPTQQHYLRQVGRQINIIKLAGYLFFGTIASVEQKIRDLIADETFKNKPIRFVIMDLWQVTGVDYSAGEVFNTISRLLDGKGIELIVSGVDPDQSLGRNLRAVGLGEDGIEVKLLPELNSALEYCENELLKTLYARQEVARAAYAASSLLPQNAPATSNLDVPAQRLAGGGTGIVGSSGTAAAGGSSSSNLTGSVSGSHRQQQQSYQARSLDLQLASSPRRSHLHEAARNALSQVEVKRQTRWQSFKEPLRLMLQIFQDVSDRNEDFWFQAVSYFKRVELQAGAVLFRRGEPAEGFYLVEQGILRVEYDLPQGGWLFESIVAGTTCGELPFFSETSRTATCVVERDPCVVWLMDRDNWEKLQVDVPEVARELLRISLKLTSERMSVITAYTLTMAG